MPKGKECPQCGKMTLHQIEDNLWECSKCGAQAMGVSGIYQIDDDGEVKKIK